MKFERTAASDVRPFYDRMKYSNRSRGSIQQMFIVTVKSNLIIMRRMVFLSLAIPGRDRRSLSVTLAIGLTVSLL